MDSSAIFIVGNRGNYQAEQNGTNHGLQQSWAHAALKIDDLNSDQAVARITDCP